MSGGLVLVLPERTNLWAEANITCVQAADPSTHKFGLPYLGTVMNAVL